MRIYSVRFGNGDFRKLEDAFQSSIKENFPQANIDMYYCDYLETHLRQSHFNNLRKLKYWMMETEETKKPILFLDTDMIILDDLSDIFKVETPIAITTRNHNTRYNAGVIYVDGSEKSKRFMRDWYHKSSYIFEHGDSLLLNTYKGLTQAAMSIVHVDYHQYITELPCDIYNLAALDWQNYSDKTKIVHIKDGLRRACLDYKELDQPYFKEIQTKFWYHLNKKASPWL